MRLPSPCRAVFAAGIALSSLLASLAHASPVTLDWVTVRDAGNAPDTTGDPNPAGAVSDWYRIMKYEVTNTQYAAFLTAVAAASDPYSLYNPFMNSTPVGGITRSGSSGNYTYAVKANMGDKPVVFVSWFDAARFSNWLNNGQGSGGTETGAYTLVGGQTSGTAPARNPGALYYVPSQNEWYKAAYYKGGGTNAGYWNYATRSDTAPTPVSSGSTGIGSAGSVGNFANFQLGADWNGENGNVTTVGTNGVSSAYGAFDMSGNVYEWNDLAGTAATSKGYRGGSWNSGATVQLSATESYNAGGGFEAGDIGFRLAAVPEPSTYAMALAGLAGGGYVVRRRRKRRPHGRSLAIAASLAFMATFLTVASARAAPLSFVSYTTVNGLGSDMVYSVYASGNTVYAATLGGVSISTDGGANWTNYTTTNGLGSNSVYGVFASGSTVYAATAGGVGISTNNGVNWTNYTTANGLGANDVYGIYASGGAIYAATGGGLGISTNGGANWTNRTTANGLGTNAVNSVFASGGSIYAATGGGLGISTDGGVNFTNYTTANGLVNNFVRSVSTGGGAIYVGTSGGMSISTNGGASWTTANGLASNTVYGVYASGSTVYASLFGGLGVSTTGGSNWTNYTTANGLGSNTVLGAYASGDSVYVATFGGGVGISLAPVPEPSTSCMALAGIACGGYSMWRRRKRA